MQIISAYLLAAATGGGYGGSITLFENGAFADERMAEGFDLGNYKSILASTASENIPDISNLSQYYLSEYVLWNGAMCAEPFYVEDEYLRKSGTNGNGISSTGQKVGQTNTFYYLPVRRLYGYDTLKYVAKTIKHNGLDHGADYNLFGITAAAVVNGSMETASLVEHSQTDAWTEFSVNISLLPYVDYIILFGCDGSPGYRKISLEATS